MQNLKFKNLRKKYPKFIYNSYSYKISNKNLEIFFDFKIEHEHTEQSIYFKPKIIIKDIDIGQLKKVRGRVLNNLIFHLGLIEMVSYWKATCSPIIEIQTGSLNRKQIKWWQNLIIKGMGQFFYENKINWRVSDFLKISIQGGSDPPQTEEGLTFLCLKNRYLVPFSGGKDSIVTLEKLKKRKKEIALFLVNPIKQIQKTAKVSVIKKQIIIERKIDRKLLELNKKGYLNGHTPFTALLSFLSVLCAILFNYKHIVFSNEKSANEGNVKHLGRIINHQWSKSSEFEKMFKDYCKKYLAKNINYSSHLRKYDELEISKMLIRYPQYFSVFSSCNTAMKIKPSAPRSRARRALRALLDASPRSRARRALRALLDASPRLFVKRRGSRRWCGNCPKCLFVYMALYPYLKKEELMKIFGRDIFENKKLLPTMNALMGRGKIKPFECVGTYKESKMAFNLSLEKAKKSGKIPYILTKIK